MTDFPYVRALDLQLEFPFSPLLAIPTHHLRSHPLVTPFIGQSLPRLPHIWPPIPGQDLLKLPHQMACYSTNSFALDNPLVTRLFDFKTCPSNIRAHNMFYFLVYFLIQKIGKPMRSKQNAVDRTKQRLCASFEISILSSIPS